MPARSSTAATVVASYPDSVKHCRAASISPARDASACSLRPTGPDYREFRSLTDSRSTEVACPWSSLNECRTRRGAMRVHVDGDRCQGHNRCYAIAPDLFDVDDL